MEKHPARFAELTRIRDTFPALRDDIRVENAEANQFLKELCQTRDWGNRRAVLFLDPFGMSVEWATIEAIAATKAIDLWYLFPLGVAVNRLLKKHGKIPDSWSRRLDLVFGPCDWFADFYKPRRGLFDDEEQLHMDKVVDFQGISRFFVNRLKSVFAGVAEHPLPLYSSCNNPLYLLCFATANPKAAKVAVKIAQHILGN